MSVSDSWVPQSAGVAGSGGEEGASSSSNVDGVAFVLEGVPADAVFAAVPRVLVVDGAGCAASWRSVRARVTASWGSELRAFEGGGAGGVGGEPLGVGGAADRFCGEFLLLCDRNSPQVRVSFCGAGIRRGGARRVGARRRVRALGSLTVGERQPGSPGSGCRGVGWDEGRRGEGMLTASFSCSRAYLPSLSSRRFLPCWRSTVRGAARGGVRCAHGCRRRGGVNCGLLRVAGRRASAVNRAAAPAGRFCGEFLLLCDRNSPQVGASCCGGGSWRLGVWVGMRSPPCSPSGELDCR